MRRLRSALLSALALLTSCFAVVPITARPQEREAVPQPIGPGGPRPTSSTPADIPWDPEQSPNALTFGLGAAYWDEIGSMSTAGTGWRPDQFGSFDNWGVYFDMGYDRVVGHLGAVPWSLGFEFGLASFDNRGDGLDRFSDRLDATWIRTMPTARLHLPLSDSVRLVPGLGFGGSFLSVDEYQEDNWGYAYASRTLHDEWAWSGFADLALDIDIFGEGGALRIDNEFHWVEFEQIDRLLPAESTLGGLIYTLQLELVFRF